MNTALANIKKRRKHWGNYQKYRHLFGTIWSTMDRKHPKTAIFPDAFFYTSLGICRRFPTSDPVPNAQKKALFYRRSYITGPNHALEKVLTTETPCMFFRRGTLIGPVADVLAKKQLWTTNNRIKSFEFLQYTKLP